MKCERVKRKLVAYLDGELEQRLKFKVKKHLSQCATCKGEAGLLQKTVRLLKEQEHVMPSVSFETRLWERIHQVKNRHLLPEVVVGRLGRALVPAVAVLVLVVGIVVGSLVGNVTIPSPGTSQEEAYAMAIGLDNFQDAPPGSLPEVYFTLATAGEVGGQ